MLNQYAMCLRKPASTTYNPEIFGQVLHVIQDSYIHAGWSPLWGHGFFLDEDPTKNPLEAKNMAWFTLDLISDFYHRWQTLMEAASTAARAIAIALSTFPI